MKKQVKSPQVSAGPSLEAKHVRGPSVDQLTVMRQRAGLLADIHSDRAFLKRCFDYERERVEKRIVLDLLTLNKLPTIEVVVELYMRIDSECVDRIRIVTTSPDYIADAVARAVAINKWWAGEVANGSGEVSAYVVEVIQVRSESDLYKAAAGGAE